MAAELRTPHWTAPERIAFYLLCVLIFCPFLAYVVEWRFDISSVPVDEVLVGIHVFGLLGMLGWCITYLRSDPRFARAGLIVTMVLLAVWVFTIVI